MQKRKILQQKPFFLGCWLITPANNTLKKENDEKAIQPKLMEVLVYLCLHHQKIISPDELIKHCWDNQFISDNPVHKCIAQLRKALGDSSKKPEFIATIPKRGYSVIGEVSLTQTDAQILQPYWLDKSPFRGLKPYFKNQQKIYFGRSAVVSDVLALIEKKEAETATFIVLLGASGCGKTSLLEAGILPALMQANSSNKTHYSHSCTFIPRSKESLCKAFVDFLYQQKIVSQLWQGKKFDWQEDLLHSLKSCSFLEKSAKLEQVIISIDQLELIFALGFEDVAQFFEIIDVLLQSKKCLIIAALRNEYYQQLTQEHDYIKIRSQSYHFDIPPMSYDEICEIVRKPAHVAGLSFELNEESHVSLDSFLINKAMKINIALPLLQHALSELYKNRSGNQLTFAAYHTFGGMEGGLTSVAERAFLELPEKAQQKFEDLLYSLIQINPESTETIRCKKAEIKSFQDQDVKFIIEKFTDKRLFQTHWINQDSYVSISHEVLIEHWQRMRLWVHKNTSLLNAKHDINSATQKWLRQNKDKDYLFNSQQPVNLAQTVVNNKHIQLSQNETDFITASIKRFNFAKQLKTALFVSLGFSALMLVLLTINMNSKNKQIKQTKNNAEKLISFILFDLKDRLSPLGRVDIMDLVGSKTLEYFESIGRQNLSDASLLHWVEALHVVGEVSFNKGEYQKAQQQFEKSNAILSSAIDKGPSTTEFLSKKMLSNYWLGYLHLIQKNFEQTHLFWQEYLTEAQLLSQKEPNEPNWRLETSYALNNLGTLALSQKSLNSAEDYFKRSIILKRALIEQQPENHELIAGLADSVSWLGKIKNKQNQLQEELVFNKQSLELSKQLVQWYPENQNWKYQLCYALHRVALSHYQLGDLQPARKSIDQAIELMEQMVANDLDNFTAKQELLNEYYLMSKIANYLLDDIDKSLFYLQKGQFIVEKFRVENKLNRKVTKLEIYILVERAKNMSQLKQNDTALQLLDKAHQLWQTKQFKDKEEAMLLASINLSKASVLKVMADGETQARQRELLQEVKNSLQVYTKETPPDLASIAMYLQAMRGLKPSGVDTELQTILKVAQYQNPDFTSATSVQGLKP